MRFYTIGKDLSGIFMNTDSLSREDVERMVRVSPQQFIQSLESDTFRHSLGKVLSSMSSGDVKNLCFDLSPNNNAHVAGGFKVITDPQCLNMLEYLQNTRINLQNNPHYQIGSFAIFEQEREGESLKDRMNRLESRRRDKEKTPDTLKAMNEQLMHWHVRAEISLAQMAQAFSKIADWDVENMTESDKKVLREITADSPVDNITQSIGQHYQQFTGNPLDEGLLRIIGIHSAADLKGGVNLAMERLKKLDPQAYDQFVIHMKNNQLMEDGKITLGRETYAIGFMASLVSAKHFQALFENEKAKQAAQKDAEYAQKAQKALGDNASKFNPQGVGGEIGQNLRAVVRSSHVERENTQNLLNEIASTILQRNGQDANNSAVRNLANILNMSNNPDIIRKIHGRMLSDVNNIRVSQDPATGDTLISIADESGKTLMKLRHTEGYSGGRFSMEENSFAKGSPDKHNPTLKTVTTLSVMPHSSVNLAALEQNTPKTPSEQEQQAPLMFGGNGNMQG